MPVRGRRRSAPAARDPRRSVEQAGGTGGRSVRRPATASDVEAILAAPPEPVSPLDPVRAREDFALRRHRPEWSWVAEQDERIIASVLWWGLAESSQPTALTQLWAAPGVADPTGLAGALLGAAMAALRAGGLTTTCAPPASGSSAARRDRMTTVRPRYGRRVSRRVLVVLLVAGVACAGVGTALVLRGSLVGAAAFGWTAYAPLSITSGGSRYLGFDPAWLSWAPRIGAALLAVGAGTTGAAVAALTLRRRHGWGPTAG